jgi:hypothetical protein
LQKNLDGQDYVWEFYEMENFILRRQVMTEHFIIRNIALNAAGD